MPSSRLSIHSRWSPGPTLVLAACAAGVALCWLLASWRSSASHSDEAHRRVQLPASRSLVWGEAPPAGLDLPRRDADPASVRGRLLHGGSFKGTQVAGAWCVSTSRVLTPCPDLRTRFEYYLLGLGEVRVDELRTLVAADAQGDLGPELASQIMDLWDRYWLLRNHAWLAHPDPSQPATWLASLNEQHEVRQRLLGVAWSTAFFGAEEAQVKADAQRRIDGLPALPDPGDPVPLANDETPPESLWAQRVARYGQAGAQRLAELDTAWADWNRRISMARQQWEVFNQTQSLSPDQRLQAMQSYLASNFSASELLRAHALLGL